VTTTIMLILVGLVVVGGITLVVMGLMRSGQTNTISDRLNQYTERPLSLNEMELQQPFSQRVVIPLVRSVLDVLGKYGPKQNRERLIQSIQQAGNPGRITPEVFTGVRVGLSGLLLVIFGIFTLPTLPFMQALMYSAIGAAIGFVLPGTWLGNQIKKRKKNITKALPDALDLLCISVEAGLGFDLALQRVSEKWDNELALEFRRALQDTRLGKARRDALKEMSIRTGVDDVQTFVAAIIQAEQLGVSIGKILKIQADQMRVRRRQRAEEEAHKAPIKMLIPMVFLIFPALFVVILGPSVPRLMGTNIGT
jgi:tight adherence protein C